MRGPTLRLVCVNDVYSLDELPRLRTLVRHHAESGPADVLLTTLAGDFVAPSLLSSLDQGFGMVDCLDAVPVTHVCFGNHEVDVPFSALVERVRQFRGTWLNTNIPDFTPALPATQIIELKGPGTRTVRVGLVGVVTEDPSLYRPGVFGGHPILPANATALTTARRLVDEHGCACVIALTHQSLARDQALANAQGDPPIPLLVGGHEHEPHVEMEGSAWIVKAGADARYAAVVDLAWPAEAPPAGARDLPTIAVRLEPVRDYADDPALRARVDHHMLAVKALEAAALLRLRPGEALSSVGARCRQTSLGAMLASRVRDTLHVHACLLNGGGLRGEREHRGSFTYGGLEAELPFPNEVVVASMPGRVVREAVAASRSLAPKPAPGFLQVDDAMVVTDAHEVTAIAGAPIDDARDYRVATVRVLFDGMDKVEPLLRFAREHPERVAPAGSGRELKIILVESFALTLWRALGPFEDIDTNRDARVSADELRDAIARVTREPAVPLLVEGMLRALDPAGDGSISRDEADATSQGRPRD